MDLIQANALAISLMDNYNLREKGWSFRFDKATSRFGRCNYTHKIISISRSLTKLNVEADVRNTLLHEIAHAIVGAFHGHGPVWEAKHKEIGGDGKRLYGRHITRPTHKWEATCASCGVKSYRHRLPRFERIACAACCRTYNHGKFDSKYVFNYRPSQLPAVTFNDGGNSGRAFLDGKLVNVVNGNVQP